MTVAHTEHTGSLDVYENHGEEFRSSSVGLIITGGLVENLAHQPSGPSGPRGEQ